MGGPSAVADAPSAPARDKGRLRRAGDGNRGRAQIDTTTAAVRSVETVMAHRDTSVSELCRELGIKPVTLYRCVEPQGQLREQGRTTHSWPKLFAS